MKKASLFILTLFLIPSFLWAEDENEKSDGRKVIEIYEEYKEKGAEIREEQRISGVQFVADFITDKLPLTLDLGAEPGQHGSTIFGILQYDWSEKMSSKIRLSYSSQFSENVENGGAGYIENREIETIILPYMRYFGDEDKNAKTPFFYVGAGAFYSFDWGKINAFAVNEKSILSATVDFHYHKFGPEIEGGLKFPIKNAFVLGLEISHRPISLIINSMSVKSSTTSIVENETAPKRELMNLDAGSKTWSQPYISQTVFMDFFTYFRLKTVFTYDKVILQQKEQDDSGNWTGDDETQESFTWRFGAEIVFPSSNKTRKKNAHLWAGLYYELEWVKNSVNDESKTEKDGKIVFCFGT